MNAEQASKLTVENRDKIREAKEDQRRKEIIIAGKRVNETIIKTVSDGRNDCFVNVNRFAINIQIRISKDMRICNRIA